MDSDESDTKDAQQKPRSMCRGRILCLLALLLIAIAGGVAAYIILVDPLNVGSAPMTPPVSDQISKTPSESPTVSTSKAPSETLLFGPPSKEDCEAIRNGQRVDGQYELGVLYFDIAIEIILDEERNFAGAMATLIMEVQQELLPSLAGCTDSSRRSLEHTREDSQTLLQKSRRLEDDQYSIANAFVSGDYDNEAACRDDVVEDCRIGKLTLEIFVKRDGQESAVEGIINDVFGMNEPSQSLGNKLELVEDSVLDIRILTLDPSNGPNSAPLPIAVPSVDPSAFPSLSPSITLSDNPDPVVGTCGNGSLGNGICSDPSLCCSQWGWCDNSPGHCGDNPTPFPTLQPPSPVQTLPPTQAAPTPTTNDSPPNSMDAEHSRLIAYVGNWQACPTRYQWEQYTHIVISFGVSYTWSPGKNQCSAACDIATPPVCSNAPNPTLIQEWKDAGKKVLLSFGGAGMGGSWAGDANDCWEYCFGKEDHVVDQLVSIANNMNLDGIDLDYEYFYEDNQNNSGFSKGTEAQHFLSSVTTGLRQKLPSDSIVTHAPMDVDLQLGTDYYNILKNQAHELDFLMPQYYNGVTRPGSNFVGALNHYTVLVDEIFQGDPTKIVFGFCIADCGDSNLNGSQSALVMTQLQSTYPCNGGAFFWIAQHDVGGAWSASVSTAIGQNVCQG